MNNTPEIPILKLNKPVPGRIAKGGYIISYEGTVPQGVTLWLGLPDLENAMEVTGRNKNDLLDFTNLPVFLSLIGKQKTWWGGSGKCRLFAKRGAAVIAQSNLIEDFPCPVRPLAVHLSPALGRGDSGPVLKYTGTPPKYADGRVLYIPAIDGCYYFAYKGLFETDNNKRGFNCITYVGAVFGVDVNSGAMASRGMELAKYCGSTSTGYEGVTLQEVKTFFKSHRGGTYFLYSNRHIVLVVNGFVNEFRERVKKYNRKDVDQWDHIDARWWVRRSLKQF